MKVTLHNLRLALCAPQVGADPVDHLPLVARSTATHSVALDILVEKFVGVEFGTVTRQVEQPQMIAVLGHPMFHGRRPMHRVAIDNQDRLASDLPHQATEERQEDRGREPLLEHHEQQLPAVGDRRDHVAAKSLARAWYRRRLAASAVTGADLMIAAHSHLIAPVNRSLFGLRLTADGRILVGQPARSADEARQPSPPGN